MKRQLAVALALSLAAHGAGFGYFTRPNQVIIQGGAPSQSASLGSSFADMVSGTASPVTPEVTEETNRPETNEPREPDTTEQVRPDATEPPKVTSTATPAASTAPTPSVKTTAAVATTPATTTPAEPDKAEPTAAPAPAPENVEPNVIKGQEPIVVQQADANTERPKARPTQKPKPKRPQPAGNAAQDATRGTNEGTRTATANSASQNRQNATQQGNSAAVSNYPGKVWSKLQRGRKPRGLRRGSATVAFRIAANGTLAGASIAKTSGSARLDQAALRHVRRAAPFPAPPPGAKTRFRFIFEVN